MSSKALLATLLLLTSSALAAGPGPDSEFGIGFSKLGLAEGPTAAYPSPPPSGILLAQLRTTFWFDTSVGYDFGPYLTAGGMTGSIYNQWQTMMYGFGLKIRVPPLGPFSPWMAAESTYLQLCPEPTWVTYRANASFLTFRIGIEFDPGKAGTLFFNPEIAFYEYGSSSYTSGTANLGIRY